MAVIHDSSKSCISTSHAHDMYGEWGVGGGSVKSETFAFIFTLSCENVGEMCVKSLSVKDFFRLLLERGKGFIQSLMALL